LEHFYTGWIVVVQLYCGFSLCHQMAPQQSAKFIAVFFGQFRTNLRNDSVVNYESNWTLFSKSVIRCAMQRIKHFADICVVGAARFGKSRSKFCKA